MMMIKHHVWELMKLQLYHALPSETAYIFSKLYFDVFVFYNSILICATIHNPVFWFWRYLTRFLVYI